MYYQFTLIKITYIYFIYGLSFVVLGLAVLLNYIQFKKTLLVKDIWWLGAFGIAHGLAEWAVMFTTLKYFMGIPAALLVRDYTGEVLLYIISFIFLSQFGIRVINSPARRFRWLGYSFLGIAGLLLITWGAAVILPHKDPVLWLEAVERLSRYLMCFPGTILAGLGFLWQRNELEKIEEPRAKGMLYGVSLSFLLYGIAAGLLASRSSFFPSSGLSPQSDILAIAILPMLRSLGGIGIAYFTIRVVVAFNHGYIHLLEVMERQQALSREREHISRDLHDGIIQSLYAIGLQLKETTYQTQECPQQAQQALEQMMDRLDGIIDNIRLFIQDLRLPEGRKGNLIQVLKPHLANFSSLTKIDVELSAPDPELMSSLSPEQINHLYYIIQEALVNVAKHADAKQIYVELVERNHKLYLSIIDDGNGMIERPCDISPLSGYGMGNIRSRVEILNGRCSWESHQGFGTRLIVVVPLGKHTEGKKNSNA